MNKIEELNAIRKKRRMSYKELAERSGVPLGTIQKIFGGYTRSPRYDNLLAIEQVVTAPAEGTVLPGWSEDAFYEHMKLEESAAPYQAGDRGEYTVDDLKKTDDAIRYELMDGRLYALATPRVAHQLVVNEIRRQLETFITGQGGPCLVLDSGIAVNPEGNDRDWLIPDLMVACDPGIFDEWAARKGPDMVVEVLSRTTRLRDLYYKVGKYCDFGVREYWIVDVAREKVVVHVFNQEEDDGTSETYTFSEPVPVAIFDGQASIDLSRIRELLDQWHVTP